MLINSIVENQLNELGRSGDGGKTERKLYDLANESDIGKPGLLDNSSNKMKRMPLELRDVKKQRVGRHRIYYVGHHSDCSYRTIFIKTNKKNDVDKEDDKGFQSKLKSALSRAGLKEIEGQEQEPDS
jgi:hypothetical protein